LPQCWLLISNRWFLLRSRSSRMVVSLRFVQTRLTPYFMEKTSVKTIINCFHPRFPAFGAIQE